MKHVRYRHYTIELPPLTLSPASPAAVKCDFCSARPVVARWDVPDFQMTTCPFGSLESIGAWAACAECDRLVQAGDEAAVIERALALIPGGFGAAPGQRLYTSAERRAIFTQGQQPFWIMRQIGEAVRRPFEEEKEGPAPKK